MKKIKTLFLVMATMIMTMMFGVLVSAATYEAPTKITGLKQTSARTSAFDVAWDAQIDCNYQLELSTDGRTWTNVEETTSATSYESGLSAGKSYYARVRGYRSEWRWSDESERVYGPWSDVVEIVTVPDSVTTITQTGATLNTAAFTWTAVPGATHYSVKITVNGIDRHVGTVNTNSINITGLSRESFSVTVNSVKQSSAGFAAVESYGETLYSSDINLIPSKPGNVYIANYWESLKEVNVKWDGAMFADGYQIETYKGSSKKPMSTLRNTYSSSVYIKNINQKNFYKVRVRAYTTINGKIVYGEWSDYTHFAQQPKLKLKWVSSKKLKVSWSKVKGATSYTVYMSTKQKSGYKKVKTLKKTSLTIKKFKKKALKSSKTYYVYVVANKKVGKKTVKSNASQCYYLKKY